jgi:hypothetical protein
MMEKGFSSLEETITKLMVESMINSLVAANGSIEVY